jgi:hypothetical protein
MLDDYSLGSRTRPHVKPLDKDVGSDLGPNTRGCTTWR